MKKILEMFLFASLGIFFLVCSTNDVFALSATKNTLGFKFKNFPLTYYTGNDIFTQLAVQLDDNLNNNIISIQSEFYNISYEKIVFSGSFCMSPLFDGIIWENTTHIKQTNNACVFKNGEAGMRYDFTSVRSLQQVSSTNMGTYTLGFRFQKKNLEWTYFELQSLKFSTYDALSSVSGSIIGAADDIKNSMLNNFNALTGSIVGGNQDIINNQNKNKDEIINNQNENSQKEIDNANKNHEEAEKTRRGILGTIKSVLEGIINLPSKLVNLLIDALKSLFIPSDSFFQDWFKDVQKSFEKQLGFLSYPFTWILEILNRFLNLTDTGHYIISWSSLKVPNFNFNIINSGSYDLATLLQNSTINRFHELYFTITNALMLLAFFGLCMNTYNKIFGGDTDNYEYISVDEGYSIDDSTGEATNHWIRERKTRREKI